MFSLKDMWGRGLIMPVFRQTGRLVARRNVMTESHWSFPWIHFVPQQQRYVVHRFGKRIATREPGICFTFPFIDEVAFVRGLSEDTIKIKPQHIITDDNVEVEVDAVVYYQVTDVEKSCYEISNPQFAITNLAMSVMRKALGKKTFNQINQSRSSLNEEIKDALQDIQSRWGIAVNRYEIQDVVPSKKMSLAMEKVAEAERNKTAAITNSEADRIEQENVSLGNQNAAINRARGEAEAMKLIADATAASIRTVAQAVNEPGGKDALSARIATEYIEQLTGVLGASKTVVVPANPLDVNGILKTAMEISKTS